MKKQFLTGLAVVTAVSMLCGFDSAETADSLGQKMNEAGSTATSVTASVDFNLDAALKMSDGTTDSDMSFAFSGPLSISCTLDPSVVKMEGTVSTSMMGQSDTISLQAYSALNDDGTVTVYQEQDGAWTVNTSDNSGFSQLMDALSGAALNFSDLQEWGFSFELAPEAADVDGTECYLLSSVIDSDALNTLIEKASSVSGEDLSSDENVSLALSALGGLKVNLEYYVDASTYLPVKIHVDFNDSDFSSLSQLIMASMGSGADTSIDLVLNDATLDMTTSYNTVDEIVIPDEAIAAAATAE